MSVIEEIKESLAHTKMLLNGIDDEIKQLQAKKDYYAGHYDGMSTALDILNKKE